MSNMTSWAAERIALEDENYWYKIHKVCPSIPLVVLEALGNINRNKDVILKYDPSKQLFRVSTDVDGHIIIIDFSLEYYHKIRKLFKNHEKFERAMKHPVGLFLEPQI